MIDGLEDVTGGHVLNGDRDVLNLAPKDRAIAAGEEVGQRLGLAPAALVVALERWLYADGEPMALDYSNFASARFPGDGLASRRSRGL